MGDFMNKNGLRAVTDTKKYMFSEKSDIFKRCGLSASVTDYASPQNLGSFNYPYFSYNHNDIGFIGAYGQYTSLADLDYSMIHMIGIRPILDYSSIDLPNDRLDKSNGFFKFKYGNFPTKMATYPGVIDDYLKNNQLILTDNYHIKANLQYDELYGSARLREYYNDSQNKEYVRVEKDNSKFDWFSVEPLYWYVDKENKLLISNRILFSIALTHNIKGDNIVEYINEHFLKEIVYNETITLSSNKTIAFNIPDKYKFNPKGLSIKQVDKIDYDKQLSRFMNLPPEQLDLNILSATIYGKDLAEHAQAISSASFYIMDKIKADSESIDEIIKQISKLNQRRPSIFSKIYTVDQIAQNNKQILKDVEQFLIEQQNIKIEQIKIFDYDKKLIALFVERLNSYIAIIKKCLMNLENIDNHNQLKKSDYEGIKSILEQKLYDYREAVDIHTTQYEQISQLANNDAIYLTQIMSFHLTKFPSLCTSSAISTSILSQKENNFLINEINLLLQNMMKSNNDYLNNDKQIENLDQSVYSMLTNEGIIESSNTDQKLESDSYKILTKK